MGRRGWRAIPPELMVPTVIAGLMRPVVAWLDSPRGGVRTEQMVVTAQSILVLFGLLELRRRLTGAAARWITIAAVLASFTVVELVLVEFAPVLGFDREDWFPSMVPTIDTWHTVAVAVVLTSAARTWRSPLGALLVVAAVLNQPPRIVLRAIFDAFNTLGPVIFVPIWIGHLVLVLATYARLGAAIAPAPDIGRAERGARRAARWQRLRVAAVVLTGAAFAVYLLSPEWAYIPAIVGWFLAVVAAGGTISGLLGVARGDLPGLSARGLCIAAFATLLSVFTAERDTFRVYGLWETVHDTDAWQVAGVLATQLGAAVGVAVVGSYLRTLDDRPLARAVQYWLGCMVILGVATVVATAVGPLGSAHQMIGATVLVLSAQAISLLILAHVHARLARRLALASAVDAF